MTHAKKKKSTDQRKKNPKKKSPKISGQNLILQKGYYSFPKFLTNSGKITYEVHGGFGDGSVTQFLVLGQPDVQILGRLSKS
jgi:hypothetical protein